MEKVEVNSERWLSLEDLNGEIWKDTEYPFYQISNYGRRHTNTATRHLSADFG